MRLILSVLSLIVVLTSCFDSKEQQVIQQDTTQFQNLDFANQPKIDTSVSIGIAPSALKDCLPATFRGAEKLPSSSGSVEIQGIKVTKTTGEYVYPQGTITITMADYAGAASTVAYRYELPKTQEPGMEIQKIILPNGVGYSRYSPNESMMQIYCLINNRIAVEIIATGDETWFNDQTIISSMIPADCLVRNITSKK
jgi:hypothetical protein